MPTFVYASVIVNRTLMGVIENETLGSSPCDRKSHTDGESEKERLGSSPCDQKSHTDGESENETLGSSLCDQKSHTDGESTSSGVWWYKLQTINSTNQQCDVTLNRINQIERS